LELDHVTDLSVAVLGKTVALSCTATSTFSSFDVIESDTDVGSSVAAITTGIVEAIGAIAKTSKKTKTDDIIFFAFFISMLPFSL
jgi:hypothetical protein